MIALSCRRLVVTLASAVITSGVAVAVNLATNWMNNVWAWSAAAAFTVAAAGAAYVFNREKPNHSEASSLPIHQSVNDSSVAGSVIQIGQVSGNVDVQ